MDLPQQIAERVPPGRWVVGISGGADSTALLQMLRMRDDLQLIAAHLNHQTRADESDADERFVRAMASELRLSFESARLSEMQHLLNSAPANPSAKYRFARFAFFATVIETHACQGVILAHHHGDVIETVFQRLLRGSGFAGLTGIEPDTSVHGVRVLRPLLRCEPELLRAFLRSIGQSWREDSSNTSPAYSRNQVRCLLRQFPNLFESTGELQAACSALREWVCASAPTLSRRFPTRERARLPGILAAVSARRWLCDTGCPPGALESMHSEALLQMTRDASTASRHTFPGGTIVARKSGWIERIK